MKKFYAFFAMLGAMLLPMVASAEGDVWTNATTSVTTAVTNATALLLVALGIPLAFLAFGVVKNVIRRSKS